MKQLDPATEILYVRNRKRLESKLLEMPIFRLNQLEYKDLNVRFLISNLKTTKLFIHKLLKKSKKNKLKGI